MQHQAAAAHEANYTQAYLVHENSADMQAAKPILFHSPRPERSQQQAAAI
jgi:hypothetical protein